MTYNLEPPIPTGLKWRVSFQFGNVKWELYRDPVYLGWIIESLGINGETIWCALDNTANGPIKPLVCKGNLSECAHTLVNLIQEKDHEQNI